MDPAGPRLSTPDRRRPPGGSGGTRPKAPPGSMELVGDRGRRAGKGTPDRRGGLQSGVHFTISQGQMTDGFERRLGKAVGGKRSQLATCRHHVDYCHLPGPRPIPGGAPLAPRGPSGPGGAPGGEPGAAPVGAPVGAPGPPKGGRPPRVGRPGLSSPRARDGGPSGGPARGGRQGRPPRRRRRPGRRDHPPPADPAIQSGRRSPTNGSQIMPQDQNKPQTGLHRPRHG
jgi:hypothetical protein